MGNDIKSNVKTTGSELVAVTVNDPTTKEYLNSNKKLLKDFKKIQRIIIKANGKDIPILLKLAKNNLSKTSNELADDMIKELQGNFNEDSVQSFIEHSISLITSIETANHIYGNLMDINDVRRHFSVKVTKQVILRTRRLLEQLKLTNFEDKTKLSIIVEQLNLCIRVFEYCWEIYSKNIKALKETNFIIEVMVNNRVKLGLDNYSIEILRMSIEKNQHKILTAKVSEENLHSAIIQNAIKEDLNPKEASSDNFVKGEIFGEGIHADNSTTALVDSTSTMTEKFIDITNKVIKDVSESSSNDFMNIALQKFYSIIGAVETMNYLKGSVINKKAVSQNISTLLTEMIFSNYTAIFKSWKDMPDKNPEDYIAYSKEMKKYCDILKEAYNMATTNIDSLKKCVTIENDLYLMREDFKFKKFEMDKLNSAIESNLKVIHAVDPNFNLVRVKDEKEGKKKKSLWAKIFN